MEELKELRLYNQIANLEFKLTAAAAREAKLRTAIERAEQTLRNLANGDLSGDAQVIAMNESDNLRDALKG
ncbi:MAG: hypothetical protein A2W25_15475 [candidate division Zixibacteria bacterium RBG_16_53_22]|nr:MAG: hypothetical protein A2W25_15475 [candidate division Zixibacteria bacterium RBG_16_53_22]